MKRTAVSILICMIALLNVGTGYAAERDRFSEAELTVTEITAPTLVNQGVDSQYRHNGSGDKSVYYYGYIRRPAKLTEDIFDECYQYMCYGTGSEIRELNHNLMSFNFDVPECGAGVNDCLYFSFYYRSAPEFTGADNNTYTGMAQHPEIRFNNKEVAMYELGTGSTGYSEFVPDGKWHRAEYYLPLTEELYEEKLGGEIDALQFRISFLKLNLPAYIEFAGMRYGVMKLGEGDVCTNKKAYTYLGYLLQNGKLFSLTADGSAAELKNGVYEYTVSPQTDNPTIEAENIGGVDTSVEITKKKTTEYEIKVYSLGYDTRLADNEKRRYIKCTAEDGSFDENGTVSEYSVRNADHYSIYRLFLNLKTAEAELKVNGENKSDISGCSGGDIIEINESIINPDGENLEYITLLLFYKDSAISDIIPFRTCLSSEQESVTERFEFELPDKDYSGMYIDCLIINTETFGDVLK